MKKDLRIALKNDIFYQLRKQCQAEGEVEL